MVLHGRLCGRAGGRQFKKGYKAEMLLTYIDKSLIEREGDTKGSELEIRKIPNAP